MSKTVRSILLCGVLHVSLLASTQDTIVFPELSGQPVGQRFEFLEDKKGTLNLEQVTQAQGYFRLAQDVPNLGSTNSYYWARVAITNNAGDPILSIPHPEIDELDLYLLSGNKYELLAHVGQSVPFGERVSEEQEFSFPLPIPAGTTRQLYLRIGSKKQLQLPLIFETTTGQDRGRNNRSLFFGSYIGIMLFMALYNLFIFLSLRERTYLKYVSYIVSVGLTQLAFFGIGPFYLWPQSTFLATNATVLLTLLTASLAIEFIRSFLRTKTTSPEIDQWFRWFHLTFAVVAITYVAIDPIIGYKAAQLVSGSAAFVLLWMIFRIWKKGSRQGGFMLLAWSVFLGGTLVFVMKDMGILPYNSWTVYTMPVGSAIEGVLLSFGLADKINILRKETERSQRQALESAKDKERFVREQNVLLEQKVYERTKDLQETNDDLRRTQSQLVSAEKMASLGQLTAGIAHEINNPVNFITSNIPPLKRNIGDLLELYKKNKELLENSCGDSYDELLQLEQQIDLDLSIEELQEIIESINEGADRTAEIVRGLRNFSRLDEDGLKEADLNDGLRSTVALLNPKFRDVMQLEMDLQEIPPVECLPGKLNQVFMNLITNAAQAVEEQHGKSGQGKITVRSFEEDGSACIQITDNGCGMNEEVQQNIFDPFFTTKDVGEGTGLGLSITHSIIEQHNGTITVTSEVGTGTTFQISIPIWQQEETRARA